MNASPQLRNCGKALVLSAMFSMTLSAQCPLRGLVSLPGQACSAVYNAACSTMQSGVDFAGAQYDAATNAVADVTPDVVKNTANTILTHWKTLGATSLAIAGAYKAHQQQQQLDEQRFSDGSIMNDPTVMRCSVLRALKKEYDEHARFYRSALKSNEKNVNFQELRNYLDDLKNAFMVLLNNRRTYWEKCMSYLQAFGVTNATPAAADSNNNN